MTRLMRSQGCQVPYVARGEMDLISMRGDDGPEERPNSVKEDHEETYLYNDLARGVKHSWQPSFGGYQAIRKEPEVC